MHHQWINHSSHCSGYYWWNPHWRSYIPVCEADWDINIIRIIIVVHCCYCNYHHYYYYTCSIKDLGFFFDSKLHFHEHIDYVFSDCIKLLGLIHSITYRFSSLECLYILYFTLVKSKFEYASVVWNCCCCHYY
jgi:hypothetical protein